jgi:trk system potassium uptake protein TrkH
MTFASLAFQILGRRLSLQTQAVVHDSFFQQDVGAEFKRTFTTILLLTFGIEALGAFFLFIRFIPDMDFGAALWSSVFHSISAFCNAGFSIRSDNLIGLRHDFVVLFTIMTLIVLGGLGYMVLHELWFAGGRRLGFFPVMRFIERRFSFHSRVVMYVTSILLVGGTFMLIASGLTPAEITWYEKGMNAAFQSVSSRTAGFNSVDIGLLPSASLFILIVLMFIGGSPGSCAGGIKTTSVAIWLARRRDKGRPAPGWEKVWAATVWGQPLALAAAVAALLLAERAILPVYLGTALAAYAVAGPAPNVAFLTGALRPYHCGRVSSRGHRARRHLGSEGL